MFQYRIETRADSAALYLHGELDIEASEIMEEGITPALLDCHSLVVDFGDVSFVDSTGIGLFIQMVKRLAEAGHRVIVVNLSDDVAQIFRILQLPEILGNDVFPELLPNP